MKTIYKYQFKICEQFKIMLSPNCNPLMVELQNGIPTMWILVDTEEMTRETKFRVVGTGHNLEFLNEELFFHAGSFIHDKFVWHVFQSH